LAPTGDGLLTGCCWPSCSFDEGPSPSWPAPPGARAQELFSVSIEHFNDDEVQHLFNELLEFYGVERADVRLLVRPSGTEPVVRIMIEALDAEFVEVFSDRLKSLYAT